MTHRDPSPADVSFDKLARGIGNGTLSRRRALALVGTSLLGGTLSSLALLSDAEAASCKAKCNKKDDKKAKKQCLKKCAPVRQAPTFACPTLGSACGFGSNLLYCACRLSPEGTQSCTNVTSPPNGASFVRCGQFGVCPPGQICDVASNVCRTTCQTG